MLSGLLAIVLPPCCAACRAPGLRPADVLCAQCRRGLPWLPADCCGRCALPEPCGPRCPAGAAAFDRAWAAVAYDGAARDAVRALKFSAARPLAGVMAAQIAACVPRELLSRDAVLVAVPAHPGRRRQRGFDPAELIARALARRSGLALRRTLRREDGAQRQVGASRSVRTQRARLAFSAGAEAPRHAVLVDDVHTTGATLDACARALRGAGATHVSAVTWARTLTQRLDERARRLDERAH